jgi:hypothetical protein
MDLTGQDEAELREFWVLDEHDELVLENRGGVTAVGLALLLKFFRRRGRFPVGVRDLPVGAVDFLSVQLGVEASGFAAYDWSGATAEYHRREVRRHLGFRVATVSDQDRPSEWLAAESVFGERQVDRVTLALTARFWSERIELPSAGRGLLR